MNIRNKLSRAIKSTISLRLDLVIIFGSAVLSIVLIDFWLINIPELFNGGAKLGQIIYNLSFAYVTAFIFYFLVVHLKNQKDKENVYNYISSKTQMVIGQAKGLIDSFANSANVTVVNDYPNSTELHSICLAIKPNSNSPLVIGAPGNYANWIQYFEYYKNRSNDATDKILSKLQYLDSELVIKLAKIEDCSHFHNISYYNVPVGNTNLTAFESMISDYFHLVKDLEKYYKKNLKENK